MNVICATFNSISTISRCMDAFKKQHGSHKFLFQDGASTDGTKQYIETAIREYEGHHQFLLESNKDRGLYFALNRAISRVTQGPIMFCHSDDSLVSRETLNVVESWHQKGFDAVCGGVSHVSPTSNKLVRIWKSTPFRSHLPGFLPPHPGVSVTKAVFDAIGCFDTTYSISADTDWLLRYFNCDSFHTKYIDAEICEMFTGGISSNGIESWKRSWVEDYSIFQKHTRYPLFNFMLKKGNGVIGRLAASI